MAELLNSKMDKRVIFPSGEQHKFLLKIAKKLKLSWTKLADKMGMHKRTFNDWKREKYSMPLRAVRTLSRKANVQIPRFSQELAEFVGIMIGDGGISKSQVIVSLNHETEKFYSIFVKNLFEKLFKVKPSIYQKHKSTIDISVSRRELVFFCNSKRNYKVF